MIALKSKSFLTFLLIITIIGVSAGIVLYFTTLSSRTVSIEDSEFIVSNGAHEGTTSVPKIPQPFDELTIPYLRERSYQS
ncbi:MAG: hypothetical protein WAU07_02915, partial [Microgenomates group bacterium]